MTDQRDPINPRLPAAAAAMYTPWTQPVRTPTAPEGQHWNWFSESVLMNLPTYGYSGSPGVYGAVSRHLLPVTLRS